MGRADSPSEQFSFLPDSWHQVQVGDRIVSNSGTERTVLEINNAKGRLAIAFRTKRINGDVELETAHIDPQATRGIKEVLRKSPESSTESSTRAPATIQTPVPQTPAPKSKQQVSAFAPKSWSDVHPGDIGESHSGNRRLILKAVSDERDPVFECLLRTPTGEMRAERLATAQSTVEGIMCVLRPNLPVPSAGAGTRLSPILIENIDALLGRGNIGDRFTQSVFRAADLTSSSDQSLTIMVDFELATGRLLNFFKPNGQGRPTPQIRLEVMFPADPMQPLLIRNVHGGVGVPFMLLQELKVAALISNTLRRRS